ncbi:hypothetical protein GSI_10592 [Ganoderma sinense ZZ0214-1]|uniref:DUF6697 domain-containing protein n=1 Tax=Ganoderma sinense ZZ0214-1 TaxID=1077348 RepID=A0A2G8S0Z6_9APHY|nr:hypothetical protein GSI_10592 [Ganoderma sinense ZZ0214-1]
MFMAVASDSVTLNGSQASYLQLVDALSKLLKTFVATPNLAGRDPNLTHTRDGVHANGMEDAFNMELIQTFENLLHDNAELSAKRQTDLNTLNVSKPSFAQQLVKWLRLVAEAHVKSDKELESCMQARTELEAKAHAVAAEHENLSNLVAKCEETIKLWEDKKGVTLAANNVNDSICLWLSTLDGQLQSVDGKIQERDSKIAALEAECVRERLNTEEWKLKAQQATQDANNAKQTTVVALELGSSGGYATATVFHVTPNGDLSQVGSPTLRITPFEPRQVPFPFSRNPSVVAGISSQGVVPSAASSPIATDLEAHSVSLPPGRALALSKYPDIAADLPLEVDCLAVFSRDSISAILGGNWRLHHVALGPTATDFAKRHSITAYTASTVERNPWSPMRPGKHGYWFLPALETRVSFKQDDERHVFTGIHGGPYYYCGYYRIMSIGHLTLDEWMSFTYFDKQKYVRSFGSKSEDWRHCGAFSVDEIIGKIDGGHFQVPCVQLRCVRFDVEFYKELCGENDKFFQRGGGGRSFPTVEAT